MTPKPYDWTPYIDAAASRYGVPPALVNSVIGAESGGRPGAVSSAGAGGIMQLMPNTFAELRQKYGLGPDRMDPETNINAGTAYLGQLYKQFNGSWPDAIAAYNAGPNRWAQVKAGTREAPRETQAYVPKVLAGFGQEQEAGVAGYRTSYSGPGATYEAGPEFSAMLDNIRVNGPSMRNPGTFADATGMDPKGEADLRGLLDLELSGNHADGLGNLLNFGQTPSQPPRTAAMPGTTQTDRMDVSGRINELLQQYMKQPQQRSSVSPLQYALGGMSGAVQPLAGVHDRKVGIGEMLGALGGGLTRGNLAGDEAQRQQRADQIGELGTLGKIQQYQRGEATADRQLAAATAFADRLDQAGQKDLAAAVRGNPSLMDEVVKAMAASQYPKDGTGNFSLSPGQTQFDRFGKPIASVGDRPQTTTLSPGQSLVDQGTGKPITTAGGGTTQLTPEEIEKAGLPKGTIAERSPAGGLSIVSRPTTTVDGLRQEFQVLAKPMQETANAYSRVQAAYQTAQQAKDATTQGPADIAMIYGFMKMLDPGSSVMEGEQASARNAGSVPDQIRNLYNSLVKGGKLDQNTRDAMFGQAQSQMDQRVGLHRTIADQYTKLAQTNGIDAGQVVLDYTGGYKPGGAKAPDPNNPKAGDRVKNSQTGAMIEWNGNAWVPVQ